MVPVLQLLPPPQMVPLNRRRQSSLRSLLPLPPKTMRRLLDQRNSKRSLPPLFPFLLSLAVEPKNFRENFLLSNAMRCPAALLQFWLRDSVPVVGVLRGTRWGSGDLAV